MSDGAAVDVALVEYLRADAALAALCPDGVYLDEAPANSARFVLVTHEGAPTDEGIFGGRGFTTAIYRVVVVGLTPAADGAAVRDAVARIDVLLEGAAVPVADLPAPATVARVGRIRTVTVDDDDRGERWYLRGGLYEVFASY